jgi:hypothetical protein
VAKDDILKGDFQDGERHDLLVTSAAGHQPVGAADLEPELILSQIWLSPMRSISILKAGPVLPARAETLPK